MMDWCRDSIPAKSLVLRPVQPRDAAFIHNLYSDWRVAEKLNRIPVPFTLAEAEGLVSLWLSEAERAITCMFVGERTSGAKVGVVSLHHGQDQPEARIGVVGYSILPEFWAQGYATEMVGAMVDLADRAGFRSLQASTLVSNAASRRVLEKLDFELSESSFMEESLHSPPREHCKYLRRL